MFNFDATFWSNFGFTVLNLLLLYWILKKLLFKPVTNFMDNRTNKIQEAIDSSNAMKEEIENMKAEYDEKLKEAANEGKKIIEEYRGIADKEYNSAIMTAKADAQKIIEDARREIEIEKERAITDLKKEVGDLVVAASEKVIKKNIDNETNRKLISEFIDSGVA